MTPDELHTRYIQFCNTDRASRSDTDGYWLRSSLDEHVKEEVMRQAFLYIGSTLKSHEFASDKHIDLIATRIENYYLSQKDEILDLLHNTILNDQENFIERTCRSSERYMKYMLEALGQKHGGTSDIAKNIQKRRKISTSYDVVLSNGSSGPFNETIDLEHIGVFLAAQHLKLQQMGVSSNLNVLQFIGLFAVNGGRLSYSERMQHIWMAYKKLDGQENVLWKAYEKKHDFCTIPKSKQSTPKKDDISEMISYFMFSYLDDMDSSLSSLKNKSDEKEQPTFFESKDQYLTIYCNALVLEAVYSAYIATLHISPAESGSDPVLKNPKHA